MQFNKVWHPVLFANPVDATLHLIGSSLTTESFDPGLDADLILHNVLFPDPHTLIKILLLKDYKILFYT